MSNRQTLVDERPSCRQGRANHSTPQQRVTLRITTRPDQAERAHPLPSLASAYVHTARPSKTKLRFTMRTPTSWLRSTTTTTPEKNPRPQIYFPPKRMKTTLGGASPTISRISTKDRKMEKQSKNQRGEWEEEVSGGHARRRRPPEHISNVKSFVGEVGVFEKGERKELRYILENKYRR